MGPDRVRRLRYALVAICALSTAWALAVALTGGFVVHLAGVAMSSRNPQNPALLAVMSGVAAWALPMPDRRRVLRAAWQRWTGRVTAACARWPALRFADPATLVAVGGAWLQMSVWASARPLWVDEQMIALNVRDRSLAELAGPLWLGQSAPYGWLVTERLVLRVLGTGETALRLVPMAFGVLTLVLALWAGRRWMTPVGAALFVLLCGFAPWLAHFPLELKHYSADVFWGLLLPMVAVWALEAGDSSRCVRRARAWWAIAAVGHWFANGALFVTPVCAVLLWLAVWRRAGWRAALGFAVVGLVWLASFAAHFVLSMQPALESDFLRRYWAAGLPPSSAGVVDTAAWLAARLAPLASNPGGTEHWVMLWVLAALGVALTRGALGAMLAAVPLSAFALAALRLVPLEDRLAIWIVPALYFGAALFADRVVPLARAGYLGRSPARGLAALAVAAATFVLVSDVVSRGWAGYLSRLAPESNHAMFDRAAVRWLMDRRQAGDALMTTALGQPAVWWYGSLSIAQGDPPGSRQPDGGAIVEVTHAPQGECADDNLRAALVGHRRVLVYLGFPDQPSGFDDLLIARLRALGPIVDQRAFGDITRVAVVDLTAPPQSDGEPVGVEADGAPRRSTLDGCVAARAGGRW